MQENKSDQSKYQQYLKSGINFLVNLNHSFQKADIPTRQYILRSIFPEKIIFDGNNYRTSKINEAVRLILATSKGFKKNGQSDIFENTALSTRVEATGAEPL